MIMSTTKTTAVALLLALATAVSAQQNGTEDCPESWGWYPNPDNCIKYYQCQNYNRVDYICDEGKISTTLS